MGDRFWFADIAIDPADRMADYPWQPCLQLDGMCLSFDVWFRTEVECREFIAKQVIGAPLGDA